MSKWKVDEIEVQNIQISNRFPFLTNKDVDEIASHAVKSKTRKQTVWGVKVFKGKEV